MTNLYNRIVKVVLSESDVNLIADMNNINDIKNLVAMRHQQAVEKELLGIKGDLSLARSMIISWRDELPQYDLDALMLNEDLLIRLGEFINNAEEAGLDIETDNISMYEYTLQGFHDFFEELEGERK